MKHLICAIALCIATPGMAQPAAPDPAAVAAAESLLRATGFDGQLEETMQRMGAVMFDRMTQDAEKRAGQAVPAAIKVRLRAIFDETMREMMARMRPTALHDSALVYARYFTVAELRQLETLQTNPVLKKAQKIMPSMMSELMQVGMKSATQSQPELERKIALALEDWAKTGKPR